MPKLPEKYEDWTPPWGDDEIDAEKVAKLVYDLKRDVEKGKEQLAEKTSELTAITAERDEAKGKLDETLRKDEPEVERLKRENAELKAREPQKDTEAEARALRLEVALEKGLTAVQAKRLVGSSKEELEADADELLESFGGRGEGEDDGDEGPGQRRPQPARQRRIPNDPDDSKDTLGDYSPERLNEVVPTGW